VPSCYTASVLSVQIIELLAISEYEDKNKNVLELKLGIKSYIKVFKRQLVE